GDDLPFRRLEVLVPPGYGEGYPLTLVLFDDIGERKFLRPFLLSGWWSGVARTHGNTSPMSPSYFNLCKLDGDWVCAGHRLYPGGCAWKAAERVRNRSRKYVGPESVALS